MQEDFARLSASPPSAYGQHGAPSASSSGTGVPQRALRYNVVIMSYESLRSDVEWVAGVPWLYAVLDEGHVIRSPKSRITQACKRVRAMHRWAAAGGRRGGLAGRWGRAGGRG